MESSHVVNLLVKCTVHAARILQNPLDPSIFHERGQPLSVASLSGQSDQLNCPLIWGDSQVIGCCRGGARRVAARSGDKISVILVWQPIFFYLTTNNATKWQINQTTVHTNVYFTVDAIMHMYILCKQLDGSVILDIQCTQEWSGDDNM